MGLILRGEPFSNVNHMEIDIKHSQEEEWATKRSAHSKDAVLSKAFIYIGIHFNYSTQFGVSGK